MKNVFYIIILMAFLQSCQKKGVFDIEKPGSPWMRWMFYGPPDRKDGKDYDPLYKEGWIDGCETGASANTNAFYSYQLEFRQNAYKAQDPKYYKGWKDAFNYCGRYIYQWNRRVGF